MYDLSPFSAAQQQVMKFFGRHTTYQQAGKKLEKAKAAYITV